MKLFQRILILCVSLMVIFSALAKSTTLSDTFSAQAEKDKLRQELNNAYSFDVCENIVSDAITQSQLSMQKVMQLSNLTVTRANDNNCLLTSTDPICKSLIAEYDSYQKEAYEIYDFMSFTSYAKNTGCKELYP